MRLRVGLLKLVLHEKIERCGSRLFLARIFTQTLSVSRSLWQRFANMMLFQLRWDRGRETILRNWRRTKRTASTWSLGLPPPGSGIRHTAHQLPLRDPRIRLKAAHPWRDWRILM